jgi:protein tyrosine phosphatase (PTP) superfamily phosphohydrolase (DUF442 family)
MIRILTLTRAAHVMHKAFPIPVAVLLSTVLAPPAEAQQNSPAALETIRNYQVVSDRLASAGQISYEQIPLLGAQGYEVVVNLASADAERNGQEGFLVAQSGLTYVHIPVDWERPRLSDVEMFFDVMKANEDRKVFVHCFANMRASAFVYLYRTLVEGVPEAEARETMSEVWDPDGLQQWAGLIEQVRREHAGRQ